jgi:tRNA-dihydrouridine synthase A
VLFDRQELLVTREQVLAAMKPYIVAHLAAGGSLRQIARHLLGLYQGRPGARAFRRRLSMAQPGAGIETLDAAIAETLPRAA